jgi:hypothetical protein
VTSLNHSTPHLQHNLARKIQPQFSLDHSACHSFSDSLVNCYQNICCVCRVAHLEQLEIMAYLPPNKRSASRDIRQETTDAVNEENDSPITYGSDNIFNRRHGHINSLRAFKSNNSSVKSHGIDKQAAYSTRDIDQHFMPEPNRKARPGEGTLGRSLLTPDDVAFAVLFKDANPRWELDGIIFVKSDLALLPEFLSHAEHLIRRKPTTRSRINKLQGQVEPASKPSEDSQNLHPVIEAKNVCPSPLSSKEPKQDTEESYGQHEDQDTPPVNYVPTSSTPIAVFIQAPKAPVTERFAFAGWYHITNVAVLAARSAELVRMLEQKWQSPNGIRCRRPEDWGFSLNLEWAVLKLEKVEDQMAPPDIKTPRAMSVNEMLAELRMKDAN